MEKLFAALVDKYPGAEVRDVKFLVNQNQTDDQDVDMLDQELASAVLAGTPIDGPEALR